MPTLDEFRQCRDAAAVARLYGPLTGSYIVTGASSGLGLETALAVAAAGGSVVMCCRSGQKAEEAAARVRAAATAGAAVHIVPLDLASTASVRACAAQVSNYATTTEDRGPLSYPSPSPLLRSRRSAHRCVPMTPRTDASLLPLLLLLHAPPPAPLPHPHPTPQLPRGGVISALVLNAGIVGMPFGTYHPDTEPQLQVRARKEKKALCPRCQCTKVPPISI